MEMARRAGFPSLIATCVCLTTSSFLLIQLSAAENDLPCPSPCECHRENYQPYGDVNTIICSGLGLTAVPDLSSLMTSPIPNNVDLERNQIKAITKEDFPHSLKIVVLNLNANKEMNISYDAFLNLGMTLKELSIEAVDIVYDKTLVMFDSLFSLEKLSLNNNNKNHYTKGTVLDVTATLFQGEVAKKLKILHMAYCSIKTMTDNSLENLVNLEELDLSNTWLTAVPSAIKRLSNLNLVQFHYCNIQSLKNDDFAGLNKLANIDLSTNSKLATIQDGAFSGLKNSLRKLNLERCSLSEIPTKAFKDLTQLYFLDVSENKFVDLGSSPFQGEYKLKILEISSPELKFTSELFLGQTSNIVELSVPNMNLKTIPVSSLKTLTHLRSLSLEHNNITELPPRAFEGIKAKSIILDNNPLSYIAPGAFDGLPPNVVISLSRTKVTDLEFLQGYAEGAIHSVKLEETGMVCRCALKASIIAKQNIDHVFGYCSKGKRRALINSDAFEAIIDEACEEEKRNNSGNNLSLYFNIWVSSLVFLMLQQLTL